MRFLLLIFLLTAPACEGGGEGAGAETGSTSGAATGEHFVSPSGNDLTGNGSRFSPWKTLAKGVEELQAGETLTLLAGTWIEELDMPTVATEAKPITIRGQGPDNTLLDLRSLDFQHVVEFKDGASNLILEGIGIKGRPGPWWSHAIFISHEGVNKGIVLRNLRLEWEDGIKDRGSGIFVHYQEDADLLIDGVESSGFSDGIYLKGSNNIEIRNSDLHDNIEDGIDYNGGTDVLLENNFCHDNHSSGILVHGNTNFHQGGVVRGNVLQGNQNGITLNQSDGVLVERNVAFLNTEFGLKVSGGTRASRIHHNTFTANSTGAVRLRKFLEDNILRNNILTGGDQGLSARIEEEAGFDFDFNLWDPPALSIENVGRLEDLATIQGRFQGMVHAKTGNPLFRDSQGGDFILLDSSPALDVGENLGGPFDGSGPDCGAHEKP